MFLPWLRQEGRLGTPNPGAGPTTYECGRSDDAILSASFRVPQGGKEIQTESDPFQLGAAQSFAFSSSISISAVTCDLGRIDTAVFESPFTRQALKSCFFPAPGFGTFLGTISLLFKSNE